MRLLLASMLFSLLPSLTWLGNVDDALKQAEQTHKLVLINFSGSDWCGPCIRLRKEILETETFENYATDHLVLVRADFPRDKKHQLPKTQVQLNEAMAERYNPEGKFPYTVLVDEKGKVVKAWDGLPNENSTEFVQDLIHAQSNK